MNTKDVGDKGEDLACEYLVKNGYKILGRNYRITFGEIDIIAKKFTPLNKIFQILTFAFWQKL
ncbi:MAG: YraN family protein, partial [Candidatus Staskawiczbacteria bacterium]|nr:YraN family protein [Candidatus Staskawiczbacteria bacterium]